MSIGSYDYYGLCNEFITQSRKSGKTAQGRLWFEETRLYSYHSQLATVDAERKVLFLDEHISSYSNTTKRQTRILRTYTNDFTIFLVDLNDSVTDNLANYITRIEEYLAKYKRAYQLKPVWSKQAINTYHEAVAYAEFMHIDKRTTQYRNLRKLFNKFFELKLL